MPANMVGRQHTHGEHARPSGVASVLRLHARTRSSSGSRRTAQSASTSNGAAPRAIAQNERQTTLRTLQAICLAMLAERRQDGAGRPPPLEAAHHLLVELGAQLAELVGTEGYRALLSRALQLAANDFPVLTEVHPDREEPGRLLGLEKMNRRTAPDAGLDAIAATLGAVLWLLLGLIGEDLTQHVLDQAWPWIADSRRNLQSA
jgi:hypothetical protein